ncbi:MAG: hypothetical protein AVDCRST_MAG53-1623 [uncultured Solirubrobacteraceae bacterium]|uniref:Uncharacterized protein n=1 Tax=uncultured Solirubrobacteraceae bacterium TaxID=1162706 RepID=A0A6J4SFK2_9ACTN|nr:MAG: hypothetical protein AVDCRST_MAG53-1623 [uncultured Solirubrobacteraceae bacterium]
MASAVTGASDDAARGASAGAPVASVAGSGPKVVLEASGMWE